MKYFDNMMPILEKAMKTQEPALKQAAEMIADAVAADHLIYVFGSGHAGILSEESSTAPADWSPSVRSSRRD